MIKVLLILVYLWDGEVTIERKLYNSMEQCEELGYKRMEVVTNNPKYQHGYFAACIPTKVKEV